MLITAVSVVVRYCMSLMLASVSLEIRRLMIIRGERDAIIQDERYKSIWSVCTTSKAKCWTVLAALPVLLSGAASTIIEFTTSGVSASIGHTPGAEVQVLGLVGDGVHDDPPTFPTISSLIEAAGSDSGTPLNTAYLALLSSDLASVGFGSSFADVELKHRLYNSNSDDDGEEGVFVYGNIYDTPLSVNITFCVEVTEVDDDAFALTECREGLIVNKATKEFYVNYRGKVVIGDPTCSTLFEAIALGNQGVGIIKRGFTYYSVEDTEVVAAAAATCSSIFESIIESCVWQDEGVLYFGDWNVYLAGECVDGIDSFPTMAVVGIDYEPEVEQGSDTASLLASMAAEIFSGTGTLSSRQQLVDILGAVVRLESMEWGLQTAYDPVDVVDISISTWVPVFLLLALLLPAMAWLLVKWNSRGTKLFLPVRPAEWSACAARELGEAGKEDGSRLLGTVKPLDEHYGQVYAFGPVVSADDRIEESKQQRLGWVNRQAVTPATCERLSPLRSRMRGGHCASVA